MIEAATGTRPKRLTLVDEEGCEIWKYGKMGMGKHVRCIIRPVSPFVSEAFPGWQWRMGVGRWVRPDWHPWAKVYPSYASLMEAHGLEHTYVSEGPWMNHIMLNPRRDWSILDDKFRPEGVEG